jgi:hypothetical protein
VTETCSHAVLSRFLESIAQSAARQRITLSDNIRRDFFLFRHQLLKLSLGKTWAIPSSTIDLCLEQVISMRSLLLSTFLVAILASPTLAQKQPEFPRAVNLAPEFQKLDLPVREQG